MKSLIVALMSIFGLVACGETTETMSPDEQTAGEYWEDTPTWAQEDLCMYWTNFGEEETTSLLTDTAGLSDGTTQEVLSIFEREC